ncbi:MAG: hypothetical protein ACO3JL_15715, partial [Myxococcota bacterium]
EAPRLCHLAERLGHPDFAPELVATTAMQHRRELEARLTHARGDPRYVTARTLLDELAGRRLDLLQHLPALRESVERVNRDPDLPTYLSGADDGAWWTFTYHRARDAGERLVRRYGAMLRASTAEELWKRHTREREALATLEGELRSVTAQEEELVSLLREEAWLLDMLNSLEERHLSSLQARVVALCEPLPDMTLLQTFAEHDTVTSARKISGCRARVRYLEGLFVHFVEQRRGALQGRVQDLELLLTEGTSSGRPRPARTPAEFDLLLRREHQDHDAARRLHDAAVTRLFQFSHWERCDPLAGGLWWDAFMGGTLEGSFIDEVAWHRTTNPVAAPRWVKRELDDLPRASNELHAAARLEGAYASLRRVHAPAGTDTPAPPLVESVDVPPPSVPAPITFDDD